MPIYEYQCSLCHHQLEALQKMSDALLIECPACKKPSLQKLVSAAGFQLKGSGWYETDYSNKGKAKAAAESNKSDPTSQTKSTENASTSNNTPTKKTDESS